jgi:polyisoprenoid-binding protein YceI
LAAVCSAGLAAEPQPVVFHFLPAHTEVRFTLGDLIHTIHGRFDLKTGSVQYNPAGAVLSGEIVVDATSGRSGSGWRDRKMHREVLESAHFPEMVFRPDHLEGALSASGTSNLQVHGILLVHGASHEITIPAQVEIQASDWKLSAHFVIPYVKWGMKNPSSYLLRVSESVEIVIQASGSDAWPGTGSR